MKETKYYCDLCGKEVQSYDLHKTYFTAEGFFGGVMSTQKEICHNCQLEYMDAFLELLEKINDTDALEIYKSLFKK